LFPKKRGVALPPSVVKSPGKSGFTCNIESGARDESYFLDKTYEQAEATFSCNTAQALAEADIILKVNAPAVLEVPSL
jgi:NAD(P) transhydrogenase subunit alpha